MSSDEEMVAGYVNKMVKELEEQVKTKTKKNS